MGIFLGKAPLSLQELLRVLPLEERSDAEDGKTAWIHGGAMYGLFQYD